MAAAQAETAEAVKAGDVRYNQLMIDKLQIEEQLRQKLQQVSCCRACQHSVMAAGGAWRYPDLQSLRFVRHTARRAPECLYTL